MAEQSSQGSDDAGFVDANLGQLILSAAVPDESVGYSQSFDTAGVKAMVLGEFEHG